MKPGLIVLTVALSAGLLAGCGTAQRSAETRVAAPSEATPSPSGSPPSPLPQGSQPVKLDPSNFTTIVDNPLYPLTPGTKRIYRESGTEGDELNEITVTRDTKKVQGITAVVVHDVLNEPDGTPVEDTWDWYAQDKQGNVWYLGEAVQNFANGKPTDNEGSWEAGVDGAYAGIIMPAQPTVGQVYRQEYYKGHAEDSAKVLALGEGVTIPFGTFTGAIKTEDSTPLKPEVEQKYYAPGVGLVQVITVAGGTGHAELLDIVKQ